MPGTAVSILTLNLWNINEPLQIRLNELIRFLSVKRPDIVALQEVSLIDGTPQSSEIASNAGYPFHEYKRCGAWQGREEGLAILARIPFAGLGSVPLPEAQVDMQRHLQCVAFEGPKPEMSILFAQTHLAYPLGARDARMNQVLYASDALRRLRSQPQWPLVICGDLNDTPDSPSVRHLTSLPDIRLRDAWAAVHGNNPGHTFAKENTWASPQLSPGRRIDYILVSDHIAVVSCVLVLNQKDGWGPVSDHYGLLASVEISD